MNTNDTTDVNLYDEVSRSNPTTIDMLKSRQLNSKHKIEVFISNPSVPNDLLHNTFINSDQKMWFVKCNHCGKWQLLNYDGMLGFKGNVCKEREQFVCQHCDEILDPQTIIDGKWVARYKERDISGFWIHQLMRPTHSLEEQKALVKELIYEEKKSKATFYNMFLGLPYAGTDVNVDSGLIKSNLTAPIKPKNFVVMGADIGSATGHHYVIGSGDTIFAMGRAKDWTAIRRLIKEHNVQMCVVDNMPENGAAKELQAEYPGIVWRGNYVANKTDNQIDFNEETGLVNISRNIVFDNIVNELNDDEIKFAFDQNDAMLDDFCQQWATMSKIAEIDRNGNPTFKWTAPDGAWDHFAHATMYWYIARHRMETMMPRYGITQPGDGPRDTVFGRDAEDFFAGENDQKSWLDL